MSSTTLIFFFFFFNDTATTEIYTLSLHDALPISDHVGGREVVAPGEHRDDAVGVRIEGADEYVQVGRVVGDFRLGRELGDRKSTRLNSSHSQISYAVFCLKKKKKHQL